MKIKVLQIIDHLGLGGAQIVAKGIFEAFQDEAMSLYALRSTPNQMLIDNENVRIADTQNKYDVKSFFQAAKLIKSTGAETLHCHLEKATALGILLKTTLCRKTKLIVHEHGRVFENRGCYNPMLRLFKNVVDTFIAVSHATKQKLIENAGIEPGKIAVLHNFVDVQRFQRSSKDRSSKPAEKDSFVVGFAGRLIKRKGWEELLRAASLLKDTAPQIHFLIAGDGPDRKKLLPLMKKLDVGACVEYIGLVSDMVKFYNSLDCLVIPSLWEPMGIVAIEAQACGVPVIASDTGGLAEVVTNGENGLLFENRNVEDLVNKINLINKNKLLRRKITETAEQTVKKYSLANYTNALRSIYKELQYS